MVQNAPEVLTYIKYSTLCFVPDFVLRVMQLQASGRDKPLASKVTWKGIAVLWREFLIYEIRCSSWIFLDYV